MRKEVKQDLERLELLKPELKRRYDRYHDLVRKRDAARAALAEERARLGSSVHQDEAADSPLAQYARLLNAGQHSDIALRLANRELRRRRAPGQHYDPNVDDLSQNIRAIGRQLEGSADSQPGTRSHQTTSASRFNYPAVPHGHDSLSDPSASSRPLPARPPKSALVLAASPPHLPLKTPLTIASTASGLPALPPKEDLSSASYTFETSAYTEGGMPLRTLFLPEELRARFLSLAHQNTRDNLETCGILCGSLISNAFFVSRLVIPDQISTSDTCEVTEQGDIALFDYVDGQSLTVCGWIHTHPSQTCFLSSRDLHTSVGYQVMLPESVAIVCAPSKNPE